MPTPMSKFAEIAQRFRVNPNDDEAVDDFFATDVHQLAAGDREQILAELLDSDGDDETAPLPTGVALPANVRALSLASAVTVEVPARALDPRRDGGELTVVVPWIEQWLNDFLQVSGLGVIADVSVTDQQRVRVGLAGPDASLLESHEPQLLESLRHLTCRVAEVQPHLENFVDFVVRDGESNDVFIGGVAPRPLADEEPQIIRMEHIAIRAMSAEAAAAALHRSPKEFIVFRDVQTDDVSVIYKRRDRNLGLIS